MPVAAARIRGRISRRVRACIWDYFDVVCIFSLFTNIYLPLSLIITRVFMNTVLIHLLAGLSTCLGKFLAVNHKM